jgi:hypothetical protein
VGAGLIQFHRGITMANRPPASLQQSSVNSPTGNAYGSTSMGCHFALRPRAYRMVRVYRHAFAAAGADRCRTVGHTRSKQFADGWCLAERFHAASRLDLAVAG